MIHTRELTRNFRANGETVPAVRGVDIDVDAGELVSFLGPNGAGKSTTIRMLTTLLLPTSGRALVAGHDVVTEPRAVRRGIGYVGQGNSAGEDQRVGEELVTQGRCYGMSASEARSRAGDLLDMLELDGVAKRNVTKLSGGQRRRLDIAMGLIHRPALLFLDEPSTGLDPHSRANLWEHIQRLRRDEGTTIVLTTHYLDEADTVSQRLLVVDHGTVIADGSPDELKERVDGDQVSFTTGTPHAAQRAAHVTDGMAGVRRSAVESHDETTVRMRVDRGDKVLPELLRTLDTVGVEPQTIQVHRPTLDDVFLSLTGRSLRENAA